MNFREMCYDDLLAYTNALLDAIHESNSAEAILNDPNVVRNCNAFREVVHKQTRAKMEKLKKES